MKMSTIILGLDPSLTRTGYCILKDDQVVEKNVVNVTKLRGAERLHYLNAVLGHTINLYEYDLICIEGYSFGSKGRAVFNIGELGGIIRLLLFNAGYPWIEVAPASLKKFVTGSGIAEKDLVMMHVLKSWGIECLNNNEADAVALAMIGYYLLRFVAEENLCSNLKQVEVLDKIKPSLLQWVKQGSIKYE